MPKYTFNYRKEFVISVEAKDEFQAFHLITTKDQSCKIEFGSLPLWHCFLDIERAEQSDKDEK